MSARIEADGYTISRYDDLGLCIVEIDGVGLYTVRAPADERLHAKCRAAVRYWRAKRAHEAA